MALIDTLVSYWKCYENAANTTVVDAHGSNTGTASTNTTNLSAAGIIDLSFDFVPGNSERVAFSNEPAISVDNDYTINAWINPDQISNQTILSQGGANDRFNWIFRNNELVIRSFKTGNDLQAGGDWVHGTGSWHMVTMVHHSNNTAEIYVDNVELTGRTETGASSTTTTLSIGSNPQANDNFFDGEICEVAIFSSALNNSSRGELLNSGAGLAYPFTIEPEAAPLKIFDVRFG